MESIHIQIMTRDQGSLGLFLEENNTRNIDINFLQFFCIQGSVIHDCFHKYSWA